MVLCAPTARPLVPASFAVQMQCLGSVDRVVPERLAAGKALLEAVPVANLRLPQAPAEVHLLPSPAGQEVHQAKIEILDDAAHDFDLPHPVVDLREKPGALLLGSGVAAARQGPTGAAGPGAGIW